MFQNIHIKLHHLQNIAVWDGDFPSLIYQKIHHKSLPVEYWLGSIKWLYDNMLLAWWNAKKTSTTELRALQKQAGIGMDMNKY